MHSFKGPQEMFSHWAFCIMLNVMCAVQKDFLRACRSLIWETNETEVEGNKKWCALFIIYFIFIFNILQMCTDGANLWFAKIKWK